MMKRNLISGMVGLFGSLAMLANATLAAASENEAPPALDGCNVVFDSPSANASGAVPLGNGEMGACAWIETNGDILLYLVRPDSFSEACRLLKIGKVRITLAPAPATAAFRQELKLRQGRLEADFGGTHIELFTDPARPVLRVTARSARPTTLRVAYEGWRNERRVLKGAELIWTMHDAPASVEVAESADVRLTAEQAPDALAWYHRNEDSVVPFTLKHQSCDQLAGGYDPLLHRTFGAWIEGPGLKRSENNQLAGTTPSTTWDLRIACPMVVADKAEAWVNKARKIAKSAPVVDRARAQSETWWRSFWNRSWILVSGDNVGTALPPNTHPLRLGIDSNGGNRLPGTFGRIGVYSRVLTAAELATLASTAPDAAATVTEGRVVNAMAPASGTTLAIYAGLDLSRGMTLEAWIKLDNLHDGRIFDKITAGSSDGFLLDTHPGDGLRLIIGSQVSSFPKVLKAGTWHHIAVAYGTDNASRTVLLDGKELRKAGDVITNPVTCGYNRQRYVTACQGRGEFPIKFNGGAFTVEPGFANASFTYNADWRQWGDCFWFQNTRLMYHPLLATGDHELMAPYFSLYSRARPLAEARAKSWYGAEGCYFPEVMTLFGTYSNGDYGWDRNGRKPGEVMCPWWDDAWNQGPELVALMLDYWDWTGDKKFAREQLLPMAGSVLRYFDSRFKKDANGILIIDPCQVLETYWQGVVNDLPCVAGLRNITGRLSALPKGLTTAEQRAFFARMAAACPPVPTEERTVDGKQVRSLAPAEKYAKAIRNCENPELYAIWPFRLYGVGKPDLELARAAYITRKNHLDNGWGYDGNAAACLGLTDEAERILLGKCLNSHPAYRFPATWGPNFDWLPDQNHGGNLLETAQLMLMQCDGKRIQLLPAWPKKWDVEFKLHAPGKTTIAGSVVGGKLTRLDVQPPQRAKDVVVSAGFQ